MSKNHQGSLGYQMMKALQGIFRPGASRHSAKKHHRDTALITGISTMRSNSADVHQFARFIRERWPEVKDLPQVKSEMALAYIEALQERGVSGGHIGRHCATIRKLDAAAEKKAPFLRTPLHSYRFGPKEGQVVFTRSQNQFHIHRSRPWQLSITWKHRIPKLPGCST